MSPLGVHQVRRAASAVRRPQSPIVSLPRKGGSKTKRGRALLSYLALPTRYRAGSRRLRGHPNAWESWAFAEVLRENGYAVDAIDFSSRHGGIAGGPYDLAIGIGGAMFDVAELVRDGRIHLHFTGSHHAFQNQAEVDRCAEASRRTGCLIVPRRLITDGEQYDRLASVADKLTVIGNEVTLRTFPAEWRSRIRPVPVALASPVPKVNPVSSRSTSARHRGVLSLSGGGAVLKGVDLAIEVAKKVPTMKLHLVGDLQGESDFWAAYGSDIERLPNLEYHGFVPFGTRRFMQVVDQCEFVLAPSASEGMSSAVVSAWATGLYPIISPQTGVDVPDGLGLYIPELTVAGVDEAIDTALATPWTRLRDARIAGCNLAARRHSRTRRLDEIRADFVQWAGV